MHQNITERPADLDAIETAEWLEALDQILDEAGPERGRFLLERLAQHAKAQGVEIPVKFNTPYLNTIRWKKRWLIPATARSNGASRAWCVGTRCPW